MNQTEARAIIRDDFNIKLYEVIELGNEAFIYDYTLRRFIENKKRMEALNIRSPRPSHQVQGF